jgi:hypothetical protein
MREAKRLHAMVLAVHGRLRLAKVLTNMPPALHWVKKETPKRPHRLVLWCSRHLGVKPHLVAVHVERTEHEDLAVWALLRCRSKMHGMAGVELKMACEREHGLEVRAVEELRPCLDGLGLVLILQREVHEQRSIQLFLKRLFTTLNWI